MNLSIPTLISTFLLLSPLIPPFSAAINDAEAAMIARRQFNSFSDPKFDIKINIHIPTPSLRKAFTAFHAFKKAIFSDPNNFTGNWVGPNVCSYNGIFCSPSPHDPNLAVVSSVDLNGADITGFLPLQLALLTDVTIFHANSNHFCGIIPENFSGLQRMIEFDVSNNRLAGDFPKVVLKMPDLKYLDLRFNEFKGAVPPELFDKELDALFLNDNRFDSNLPENIGNSTVSIAVLANNKLTGCIPRSIGRMSNLNEFIIKNNELDGCLPVEVGLLGNVTVFDVGFNSISGVLPQSFSVLNNLEELDVSNNLLSGVVPKGVCELQTLISFTFSYNYFDKADMECAPTSPEISERVIDDRSNCLAGREKQKDAKVCAPVTSQPVNCQKFKCGYESSRRLFFNSSPPPVTLM